MNQKEIPQSEAVSLPHPGKLLIIEPLDYPNPYDYHHPHRHDYFEIILVKSGNGYQIVDFQPYNIQGGQLYTIYPGQVHLMERNTAQGMIIQFRKNIFEFIHPLKHSHLYFSQPQFDLDEETFSHLYDQTLSIYQLLQTEDLSALSIHKAYSYLQIILITLTELHSNNVDLQVQQVVTQFISLLPQYIRSKKKVAEYCELMGCSADKLNLACKNGLGKTALKLIHEELILEIRRMLLLNQLSLKEIAYELNFDSPANFSGFIKASTGLTPTELQASILKIYK
jgi:AraC family transcriptional regulator, transcriptional activator of pobA